MRKPNLLFTSLLCLICVAGFVVVGRRRLSFLYNTFDNKRFFNDFLSAELQPIQEMRLRAVQSRCLQLNDSQMEPSWYRMWINRQKRVAICIVGKAASISWLRILLQLSGKYNMTTLANRSRTTVSGQWTRYTDVAYNR